MTEARFEAIAVNQPYPFILPSEEGAVADFLRPSSNRLLITMPNISNYEAKALRKGEMRGGFFAESGAILFIWQFCDKGKPVITLDSPFDARVVPDIRLHDINSKESRLNIDVHIVDLASKIVRGLRSITMPPDLTVQFLSAVQDQLCDNNSGEQQYQRWMACQPHELVGKTKMWVLGN